MTMNFKMLAAFCAVSLGITGGLTGCATDSPNSGDGGDPASLLAQTETKDIPGYNAIVKEYKAPASADCTIKFSENSVDVSGGAVDIKDTTVIITNPGVYSVSGSCSNGKIIVSAAKGNEVTLVLGGVELTSNNNSVIECTSGKTLTLYLAEGSVNTLSDSASYSLSGGETEPDGAVFSKSDMIIAGSGKLTVNGLYKDGIKCKDTLSINCGELVVNAADDGIVGKDCVVVQDGGYTVKAGGDGIKSTNGEDAALGYVTINGGKFDIASGSDGIRAETSLCVKGGVFNIVSGGSEADAEIAVSSGNMFDRDRFFGSQGTTSKEESTSSSKGLKSGGELIIDSGELNIKSADDSIHSNSGVTVKSGTLMLSSCDDGIHADEALRISGGEITVTKSYEGLEGKNIEISGGVINVTAADDGVNAAGGDGGSEFGFNKDGNYYLSVTGGELTVNAGGDGLDSNGTISQSGGVITVYGPTDSYNAAIDYEKSYMVSGGTLIALGSRGMAQAPSTLSQPCLSVYGDVAEGSTIEVRGENDSVILSTVTPKRCQSLIFCCEEFKSGSKYGIYANGTLISEVTASDGISGDGANGNGGFGGHGGGKQDWINGDNSGFPGGDFDPNKRPGKGSDPNNSGFPDGDFDPNKRPGKDFDPNNIDSVTGATPKAGKSAA